MPKPMRVMVEVEEVAHGRLFRLLDGMPGVVSITPVGDGPKPKVSSMRGKKQGGAQTNECIVLGALISGGKSVGRPVLREALTQNGKAPNNASTIIGALVKEGQAKVVSGKGTPDVKYSATAAGKKRYETACQIQPPPSEGA